MSSNNTRLDFLRLLEQSPNYESLAGPWDREIQLSIAVSLKRIADALEQPRTRLEDDATYRARLVAHVQSVRYAPHTIERLRLASGSTLDDLGQRYGIPRRRHR